MILENSFGKEMMMAKIQCMAKVTEVSVLAEGKIQFLPGGWKIFSDFHDPSGQECGYFDGRRMPERGRTYECFV